MVSKVFLGSFFLILFSNICFAEVQKTKHPTLTIACDSLGQKKKQCIASVKDWEKATGLKAKIVEAPTGSTNRLMWAQQQLASQSDEIDVYQIDTTWSGLLKNHLEDLNPYFTEKEIKEFHPILIKNNTVDGKLVAIPWYVDLGLLIYRKDLLEKYNKPVPKTWKELKEIASHIQEKERGIGNNNFWGFVFSGKAFEGLTCNTLEWIHSHGGCSIDAHGKIKINSPEAEAALSTLHGFIKNISPEGCMNYAEEDSRGVFQSGNALFMRHWPYAIALAEAEDSPIKGKIGVGLLPVGTHENKSSSILGGWQLAVSKYSKHPKEASEMVKFLTSREQNMVRAQRASYYPPRIDLYNDKELQAYIPHSALIREALETSVVRPAGVTGTKYNQVSSEIWNAAHKVLLGKEKASASLARLEKKLKVISRNEKWT